MTLHFWESAARAVFHASWQAGVLAVLVLLICHVFTRVPAAVGCCLWLIVLVRFLLPALPQSPTSLFNLANLSKFGTVARAEIGQPSTRPETTKPIEPVDARSTAPRAAVVVEPTSSVGSSTKTSRIASIALAVWFLGFLGVSGQIALSFVALRRLLRRCRPLTDERILALLNACRIELSIRRPVALHVAGCDAAPALAGIVFPRILISQKTLDSLTSDELRWLLLHELTHARRWDLLVLRLWDLACAIHWFNPLAWWAASNARLAAELGCDEALLGKSAATERARYGEAILNMAESLIDARPIRGAVGFLVREPVLAGRIRAIASYRRRSRLGALGGSMLLAALMLAGLTDALENRASAQQPANPATTKTPPSLPSPLSPSKREAKIKIDPKELATTKGSIRVLVLEADGRPVAGAEVFANVVHPGDGRWEITNHTYFTDADGMAVVKLPPQVGITKIWASKKGNPGYPDLFACWFPQFQTDSKVIPEQFTFQPPLTVIGGVIKDDDGKPIRGVTVDVKVTYLGDGLRLPIGKPAQRPVFDEDSYWKSTNPGLPVGAVTNSKGCWVIDNVPTGAAIELELSCPGYVSEGCWNGVPRPLPMRPVGSPNGSPVVPPKKIDMRVLQDQTASIVMRRAK
jgi:beta-lactamase regulating signal transducer with metallopeptidase domain